MKIVFFGTPDYVIPVLKELYKVYGAGVDGLICVVSQSPKEAGRKKFVERSAVDNWAFKHKIKVVYDLEKVPEATLGIVAAYGKLIPNSVIKKFASGILNIHPSLLPAFRGASPVQSAIAANVNLTGVTILKMDELMDHGPIVSQFKEEILPSDTAETLRQRLFARSAEFLISLIPNYLNQKIKPKEQNHTKATFCKILKKKDGYINLTGKKTLEANDNFIRAMHPWPGAWTRVQIGPETKRLKLMPGNLVQLEGKTTVSWKQFIEGHPDFKFTD